MADTYEKDLAQKSSLTTSDFIRVVGSDNVSYKQGMSSVATTVADASGSVRAKGSLPTNTDLNTITTPSIYQVAGAYGNMPSGFTSMWGQIVVIKGSGSYVTQVFYRVTGGVYIRNLDNSTWSAWEQQPTRAEVDALNTKTALTLNYTSNSYVTEANLRNSEARKVGNLFVLKFNSSLANFPSGTSSDNTQIGTISGWAATSATNVTIAPQNGTASNGILLLGINTSGSIQISNRSGLPCNGFYRATVVAPAL